MSFRQDAPCVKCRNGESRGRSKARRTQLQLEHFIWEQPTYQANAKQGKADFLLHKAMKKSGA